MNMFACLIVVENLPQSLILVNLPDIMLPGGSWRIESCSLEGRPARRSRRARGVMGGESLASSGSRVRRDFDDLTSWEPAVLCGAGCGGIREAAVCEHPPRRSERGTGRRVVPVLPTPCLVPQTLAKIHQRTLLPPPERKSAHALYALCCCSVRSYPHERLDLELPTGRPGVRPRISSTTYSSLSEARSPRHQANKIRDS